MRYAKAELFLTYGPWGREYTNKKAWEKHWGSTNGRNSWNTGGKMRGAREGNVDHWSYQKIRLGNFYQPSNREVTSFVDRYWRSCSFLCPNLSLSFIPHLTAVKQTSRLWRREPEVVIVSPSLYHISQGDCEDKGEYCDLWADDGDCENDQDFMEEYCKKTCGWCEGESEWRM